MLKKDLIITLRVDNFMESSVILSCLAKENGVTKILAKGAKRVKSSLRMSFELFSISEVIFYFKTDRDINILKEGKILTTANDIIQDIEKYELMSRCAHYILKKFPLGGGQNFFETTKSLITTLPSLSKINKNIFYFFVLKNLKIQGEVPQFEHCEKCGANEIRFFLPENKTFSCSSCAVGENMIPVNKGILKELDYIIEKDWLILNNFDVRETTIKIIKDLSGEK
ncbi:MAG: DNA repair protein RecO [candidate division WOR-3 bacterium]